VKRRLGEPHSWSGTFREGKNCLAWPGFKPRIVQYLYYATQRKGGLESPTASLEHSEKEKLLGLAGI